MKKILILSDIPSHPCLGGNQQCIMQYVEDLRTLGFDVYFMLVKTYGMPLEYIPPTKEYWGGHYFEYDTPWLQVQYQRVVRRLCQDSYPAILDFMYPWGMNRFINKLHKQYDFSGIIVNYIWMSRAAYCNIPTKALYTHDVFSDRRKKIPQQYWYSFSEKQEAKALKRFDHVLAIQDEEHKFFQQLAPETHVVSVYSSFNFVNQPITGNKKILFFSGGSQLNLNGITRFLGEVFPKVVAQDTEIKLLIGGGICKELKDVDLHPNVQLLGRFDNPDDFYELGDICINPVFEGSGLKIKTFEAIAHGKLAIVDPHDAIGIFNPTEAPLVIAKNAESFANSILNNITNVEVLNGNKSKCAKYISSLNDYILRQYKEIFEKFSILLLSKDEIINKHG